MSETKGLKATFRTNFYLVFEKEEICSIISNTYKVKSSQVYTWVSSKHYEIQSQSNSNEIAQHFISTSNF